MHYSHVSPIQLSQQNNKNRLWGPIPDPPRGHSWEKLMEEALLWAKIGEEQGEIPVGALIVSQDGHILSKAHNRSIALCDPSAHAEIMALREAGQKKANYRLQDCFLVVTLEPCMMCTGAIREARLAGLVFGAYDMRAGAVCSTQEGLAPQLGLQTWHLGGMLEKTCLTLLQEFFQNKRIKS